MRSLVLCSLALAAVGCDGIIKGGGDAGGGAGSNPPDAVECSTAAVYPALVSACAGCHGPGTNKPYFSSLQSFESLLVAKPQWVVAGKPDESELLKLLEGKAAGTYSQMPPGEPAAAFAALAAAGKTAISMENLRCWIEGLRAAPTSTTPGPLAVAKRLSAEQVLSALQHQLQLSGQEGNLGDFTLSLPDDAPRTDIYGRGEVNIAALGGAHWLDGRRRNDSVNPVFIQTFVNVSQAYCRAAVRASPSPVLKLASISDTTATAPSKIRDNIHYLGRLLLSVKLTDGELDEYVALFKDFEADRVDAWTAVCAAMLRDPLWLTY